MMEYPFKDLLPLDEVLEREGYYTDWTHLDPEVFYSLTQISEYIKTKGFGVDVRLLISQLAEHFGLKTTQVVDLANLLQQKFENLEGVTQSFTNNINSLVAQMQADKDAVIANATVDSEVILARGGESTLAGRLDRDYANALERINFNKIYTNVLSLGCKPNDDTFDNAPLIQAEIDRLSALGGGKIFFPIGEWHVKSAITLKNWVGLIGVNRGKRDGYAHSTSFGSVIISSATTRGNIVEIDGRLDVYDNYTYSASIEHLQITGNDKTNYGLSQIASAYTIVRDVIISNCDNGLHCVGTMLDVWDNIALVGIRQKSLHIDNIYSVNTTMRFYNTYIGQSPFTNAIPIKMETYSTIDATFYSPTFETIDNGCEFGQAVFVKLIGVYCENFPRTGDKIAFRFGLVDPVLGNYFEKGVYEINGMIYRGAIEGWETNTLFKFDSHNVFSCNNAFVGKTGTVLSYDETDKGNFSLSNWRSEEGLIAQNDIDKIDKTRLHAINCQYGNNIILNNTPLKYIDVPLINGWVNLGSGNQDYEVFLEGNGFINIVGAVKSGSSQIIAQIPAPYRPKKLVTTTALQISSSTWAPTVATVNISGEVSIGTSNTANKSFNIRYKY